MLIIDVASVFVLIAARKISIVTCDAGTVKTGAADKA